MRKSAHAAIAVSCLLVIEEREGVGGATARFDPEVLEECAADQMRRLRQHRADADIDARLAEEDRQELRVRIGEVQHADVAEAADVVKVVVGSGADAGNDARPTRQR